jgi:hypothetical protein
MRNLNTMRNRTDRSSAPASQTRPKLVVGHPIPTPMREDETIPDTHAALDAARDADDYDAIRVKLDEFNREEERIRLRLIASMKASGKKNFNTMHGRVTFLPATEGKQVPDEKAAVALLEKNGIPQPPTMGEWLAQHRLHMPMKETKGMDDRIKFEMNK